MKKVITIPKEIIKKGDLVLIPRQEYEELLRIFKIIPKDQLWFWTKEWQKKEVEAEKDIELKRLNGPIKTVRGLKNALDKLKEK